jgi:CHAT domain-containing protein
MANIKHFWLYTFGLFVFTSQLYAGCSIAMLKGSYSYQGVIQFESKQCQISGDWMFDGNGGVWVKRRNTDCPELQHIDGVTFRYTLDSNCLGKSGTSGNLQLMDDGRLKLSQKSKDSRIEAIGTFNHPLTQAEAEIIQQGLARQQHILLEKIVSYQQNLAEILFQQNNYQEAKKIYLEIMAIEKKVINDSDIDFYNIYNGIGVLYISLAQYDKAEYYLKKGLDSVLKKYPPTHQNVRWAMSNLADLYITLGQYGNARQLLKRQRCLIVKQDILPIDTHDLANNMMSFGLLYQQQATNTHATDKIQLFEKAKEHYRQALVLIRKTPSDNNGALLSEALYYLADCYQNQKKDKEAEPLYREILDIRRKISLEYGVLYDRTQRNLAGIYRDRGDYAASEDLYQKVLVKQQANYSINPTVAVTLRNMALLQEKKTGYTKALEFVRQSLFIHARISVLAGSINSSNSSTFQNPYMTNNRKNAAGLLVRLLHAEINCNVRQTTNLPEAFQALQLAHGDQRTQSLQQTALRHSSHDPAIQKKVQDLWNQQTLWQDLDKRYVEMLSKPGQESAAIAKDFREKQEAAEQEIEKLDKTLQQDFPAYAQLIHPVPIGVDKVQSLLKSDEALLAYLVDEKASYVFVVRPGQAPVLHKLNSGQHALGNTVNHLREALQNPQQDGLKSFDLKVANGLYNMIFKPLEAELAGVKHIFAVTDGALQQLPLHLLVKTKPPATPDSQHGDYAHADWLAKHYAFSYLPAVHSLAYLRGNRNLRQGSHAKAPFIGFGDPLLKESLVAKANQMSEQFQQLGQFVSLGGDPSATLRELPRVPQTATALKDIASLLGDPTALYLGQLATESQVKQLSDTGRLRQHRIVGFATHALLPDVGESGLVMTPPPKKSGKAADDLTLTSALESGGKDDGYLTASEAAALDLDADWVLLAACKTATLQNTSEGLSQLAKGFFVAGARSVLASQWPVDVSTMQQLTRHLFNDLHENPSLRRAEALQHSMLKVLDRPANDCNWLCKLGLTNNNLSAHPAYWAPFVILGEGGAISAATESVL